MHFSRRAVLAGLFALVAVPVLAQGLGFGLGMQDVVVRAGGGPPGALDNFTQPTGAYSFRKLRTAYTGPAVKLQRVDTTTQDIGFIGGAFDTAAATTFCTTACTVQTWYDQSGAGRHFVQATAASQPQYLAACTPNGLPCARFVATSSMATAGSYTSTTVGTISAVANRVGAGGCVLLRVMTANTRLSADGASAPSWTMAGASGTITAPASLATWHAATAIVNGAASSHTIDGTVVSGTVTGGTNTGVFDSTGSSTNCDKSELVYWDAYAMPAGTVTALQQNQRDYWAPLPLDSLGQPSAAYSFRKLKSTYTGPAIRIRRASDNLETDINFLGFVPGLGSPLDVAAATAHCVATTCWLRTIYDQSGNIRHLQQATAGSQPQLVFNCLGTQPCAQFSAGQIILTAAAFTPTTGVQSFSVVAQRTAAASTCVLIAGNGFNNRLAGNTANQWGLFGGGGGAIGAAANDNVWHAAQAVMAGAASVLNIDGAETTGTATGNLTAGQIYTDANAGATCNKTEAVLWDAYSLTAAERTALRANQQSFWGTP